MEHSAFLFVARGIRKFLLLVLLKQPQPQPTRLESYEYLQFGFKASLVVRLL